MCRHTVANIPYRQYVEERLQQFKKQEQIALGERREKKIRDEMKFDDIEILKEQLKKDKIFAQEFLLNHNVNEF